MEKKGIRRRKRTNRWLKICALLLIVVAIVEACVLIKIIESKKEDTFVKEDMMILNVVETPIVDFVYGFEEVDSLKASYSMENPRAVTFLADIGEVKNIEFLRFYFDDEEHGTAVAIVKDKNEQQVKVSVEETKIDDSLGLASSSITRLYSLRENLTDTIISNFEIVEYISGNDYSEDEYILIDTPYFKIPFSREWEEYLVVNQTKGNPHKVTFSCQFENEKVLELFSYSFGEDAEDVIGHLNGTPVGLTIGTEEADKSWNQDEKDIFYTMREEMNFIIDHLVATGEFIIK